VEGIHTGLMGLARDAGPRLGAGRARRLVVGRASAPLKAATASGKQQGGSGAAAWRLWGGAEQAAGHGQGESGGRAR
jgi:hypothetical protein